MTYSQWRTAHRLHAAVKLLQSGQRPSQVAPKVGFSEAGLCAAIRRQWGCTPSALVGSRPLAE